MRRIATGVPALALASGERRLRVRRSDHQQSAGGHRARALAQNGQRVLQMLHNMERRDHVERAGQRPHLFRRRHAQRGARRIEPCLLDRILGHIDAVGLEAVLEAHQHVAQAAADLQQLAGAPVALDQPGVEATRPPVLVEAAAVSLKKRRAVMCSGHPSHCKPPPMA